MKLEDLIKIKNERNYESERKKLSVELNICPECDSPLIMERIEILDKPIRWFLFFKVKRLYWDYRKVCSKDKLHYEEKYN